MLPTLVLLSAAFVVALASLGIMITGCIGSVRFFRTIGNILSLALSLVGVGLWTAALVYFATAKVKENKKDLT